jgi:DHA1 family purine ribonucleoside efflux pump-like MFS transporter
MSRPSVKLENTQTDFTRRSDIVTWLPVFALALSSFALVSSELLPMALLTPLARDVGVSEGAAGQTVTLTALFAGIAAPTLALLIGRIDRKAILIGLCVLAIVSNVAVAGAANYWMLLAGRVVLGIAVGGFFALAGATVVQLVKMEGFGKGMSVVFLGISAATVLAPPAGALIGEAFGWRGGFLAAAGAGVLVLGAQIVLLPRVPAATATDLSALLGLLARPKVRVGLAVIALVVGGHLAGFTFMRPFLESARLDANAIAAILLSFGLCNVAGNAVAGFGADRDLRRAFAITGLLLGLAPFALATFAASFPAALAFAGLWGFAFGAAPVMVQAWMGRAAPDRLEAVGGLFMAALQFAIALGAILGGIAVDLFDVTFPLFITATCGLLAAALIGAEREPAAAAPVVETHSSPTLRPEDFP